MELCLGILQPQTQLALLHDPALPEEFRAPLNQLVLQSGATNDDDSFVKMCEQTAAEQKGAKPPLVEASHLQSGSNAFIAMCEQTRDEMLAAQSGEVFA